MALLKAESTTNMPVATPVSLGEYLHTIYEPDCEYLDGELVERNMAETDHAAVQGAVLAWLRQRRKQFGIQLPLVEIFTELDEDVDLSGN